MGGDWDPVNIGGIWPENELVPFFFFFVEGR